MKRLYYGELLRRIRFLDGDMLKRENVWYVYLEADHPTERRTQQFQSATLDGLIADIKAAGYPVWGRDVLDYVYPHSAWDKLMIDELVRLRALEAQMKRESEAG